MLDFLLYFFSFFLLLSSICVVFSQNTIFSVLFLMQCFLISSAILILLESEFIALILIIIYVGAVAVLFLFVLFMLDIKVKNLTIDTVYHFPFGVFVNIFLFVEIVNSISCSLSANPCSGNFYSSYNWHNKIDSLKDIEVFGNVLYTQYVAQFLVVGLILFLSTISIAFLTAITSRNNKNQIVFHQLSRNSTVF